MRTRVVVVRHGESVHSVEGVVGGVRGCRGLTETGHRQARAVAERLAGELAGPVAVYSSVLRRAVETARPIAAAFGTESVEDCGLCTWHMPDYADGMPVARFQSEHRAEGGGLYRPFEEGNESWAEVMVRLGRTITGIAQRHRGGTAVLVGHSETVGGSFHALGGQPLFPAFDLEVAPASVTEWVTDGDPAAWPPARWALRRFSA
ncbi:histidine phosphatase family protein [Actinoplanes sp. NBC_00393]|uniref:histidine phosphatase family protein n=1 Tax=Actinoplanes sp. NBC_00393 TaxID=2975953 RepID=UPI002E1C8868